MTLNGQGTRRQSLLQNAAMLVVTPPVLAAPGIAEGLSTAQGQRVLLVERGSREPAVGEDWIVIECHGTLANVASLLCRAMARLTHVLEELSGPFVFIGHPRVRIPRGGPIGGATATVERAPDGDLALLVLGESFATGRLLGPFFRFAGGHQSMDVETLTRSLSAMTRTGPS